MIEGQRLKDADMTKQNKADEQGDALTPGAIATMRELGWSEARIEAERQNAERIRAAGGFPEFVRKAEAARLFSEATGAHAEPEHITRTPYASRAELLAQVADDEASPPAWWAYLFSVELAERNGWSDETLRAAAEATFMRTFEAKAHTLPLLQYPSMEPWPHPLPLPPRWREGHFILKTDLREWAKEHAPHWLGSALLAEPAPESAPAGEPATIAGQGTPAEQWSAAKGDTKRRAPLAVAMVKQCQDNKSEAARRLGLETGTAPLYRALKWAKKNPPASVAPSVAAVAPMYGQLGVKPHKT